jgi:hypothetical protein
MPIDVSEVINDPDFCQSFTVTRTTGHFDLGGWVAYTPETLSMEGVVSPTNPDEIQQLPEADRITGSNTFYSTVPIYQTRDGAVSDKIAYNGQTYRIAAVFDYSAYGYYKAIGVRMSGE